jgi:hypothetical protein
VTPSTHRRCNAQLAAEVEAAELLVHMVDDDEGSAQHMQRWAADNSAIATPLVRSVFRRFLLHSHPLNEWRTIPVLVAGAVLNEVSRVCYVSHALLHGTV